MAHGESFTVAKWLRQSRWIGLATKNIKLRHGTRAPGKEVI